MAAEYSLGAQSLPCTTCYIATDHLGSTRMVTDQNANVVGRHDYLPFGEEIAANTGGRNSNFGTQDFVNQKFTAKERDSETQLDFFQARYFSAAQGRFLGPDPGNAGASLTDPQSWNGYAYVRNSPLTLVDPSGTCAVSFAGITQGYEEESPFDQMASSLGAEQVYPYSGLNRVESGLDVISQAMGANGSTALGVAALRDALHLNSGNIDIVAYSGGAATFTSAFAQLSPSEQQRIGSILYISPGAATNVAVNANTSVVRGQGAQDIAAMAGTGIPFGTPTSQTHCAHTDLGCLARAARRQLNTIKANGPCSVQTVFTRQAPPPLPPPTSRPGTNFGGLGLPGDEFDWLQIILGQQGTATSTISYQ
jgi:RHS repeat-associated protein